MSLPAKPTPNPSQLLTTLLSLAARLGAAGPGTQLHALSLRAGALSNPRIANALLSYYSKTRRPGHTRRLFDEILHPNVFARTTVLSALAKAGRFSDCLQLFGQMPKNETSLWNALITGAIGNGRWGLAFELLVRMCRDGVWLDRYTFASVLGLCDSENSLAFGRQVHGLAARTGIAACEVSVVNALVTMYSDCGAIGDAQDMFGEGAVHDRITYNALMTGLVRWGMDSEALQVFKDMMKRSDSLRPNEVTILSVLSACVSKEAGEQVHALAIKIGLDSSVLVGNILVSMYAEVADLVLARRAFEVIVEKDAVSWNSLVSVYSRGDCYEPAIGACREMKRNGFEADDFTYGSLVACSQDSMHGRMIQVSALKEGFVNSVFVGNALISAYCKCGEVEIAHQILNEMPSKNRVTWNTIITGFMLNGCLVRGLESFSTMVKSDIKPSSYILSTVVSSCAAIAALRQGKQLHCYILGSHPCADPSLSNSLIAMYAKCGNLDYSSKVFHGMPHRDVVSWNAMITAFAENGDGHGALCHFELMQRSGSTKPDKATFTTVLSACSRAGLVEEGQLVFSSMARDYQIEPEADHYTCIVDLLARAGHLDDAEALVKSMQCKVDSHIWWVLLSACSTHGNVRLGRTAAGFLLEMEPENPEIYVALSSMYAANGQWDKASRLREEMWVRRMLKEPGRSCIGDDRLQVLGSNS